jgi:hypothetical protein
MALKISYGRDQRRTRWQRWVLMIKIWLRNLSRW